MSGYLFGVFSDSRGNHGVQILSVVEIYRSVD